MYICKFSNSNVDPLCSGVNGVHMFFGLSGLNLLIRNFFKTECRSCGGFEIRIVCFSQLVRYYYYISVSFRNEMSIQWVFSNMGIMLYSMVRLYMYICWYSKQNVDPVVDVEY